MWLLKAIKDGTLFLAAKQKISIQERTIRSSLAWRWVLVKCCPFNETSTLRASDADFLSAALPQGFGLKDILYLLIDRPWPTPHINGDTSNMRSVQHLLLWGSSQCHGGVQHNSFYRKSLQEEETPLSSLSCWVFLSCLGSSGLRIRVGPSVSLSPGAAAATPPLSQLRNGFPTISIFIDAPNCK